MSVTSMVIGHKQQNETIPWIVIWAWGEEKPTFPRFWRDLLYMILVYESSGNPVSVYNLWVTSKSWKEKRFETRTNKKWYSAKRSVPRNHEFHKKVEVPGENSNSNRNSKIDKNSSFTVQFSSVQTKWHFLLSVQFGLWFFGGIAKKRWMIKKQGSGEDKTQKSTMKEKRSVVRSQLSDVTSQKIVKMKMHIRIRRS